DGRYRYASVTVLRASRRFAWPPPVQAARDMQVPRAPDSLFEVAIDEALTNLVKCGNASHRSDARITCEQELADRCLCVKWHRRPRSEKARLKACRASDRGSLSQPVWRLSRSLRCWARTSPLRASPPGPTWCGRIP